MTDEAKRCVEHLRENAEFQWCSDCYISDGCGDAYKSNCFFLRLAGLIESLCAELEKVEREMDALIPKAVLCEEAIAAGAKMQRERDALMKDVSGYCSTCAFLHDCAKHDLNDSAPFSRWYYGDCEDWQWRGVKEESDD